LSAWLEQVRSYLSDKWAAIRAGSRRQCPECSAEVSASARTCFMCGANLPTRKRRPTSARLPHLAGQPSAASATGLICPHCGAPVSRTAKVCSLCETPLKHQAHKTAIDLGPAVEETVPGERHHLRRACPSCGARIDEQSENCPMCGLDVKRAVLEQAIQEQPGEPPAEPETTEAAEHIVAQIVEQEGQWVCSCLV